MIKRFTFQDVFEFCEGSISYTETEVCEECFNDMSRTIDLSSLNKRPWKKHIDLCRKKTETLDRIGLYLDKANDDNCDICGKYRNHAISVFLARNGLRSDLRKYIVAYTLYRNSIKSIGKKKTDSIIDSILPKK